MTDNNNLTWADFGKTDLLPAGHTLGEVGLLFEKIEDDIIEKQIQKLRKTKETNQARNDVKEIKPTIEFADFEKMDIRVGTVQACQKVPKADKLLELKINDGVGERTIVSGIAKHYAPEDLIGKQVCFIANLAPRKLKGIESQGMILFAENAGGQLVAIQPEKVVSAGSEVK
jgi:methionyl-tRNA synthetase